MEERDTGSSPLKLHGGICPSPSLAAGSTGGAGVPLCPRARRRGGPQRYVLQVKRAAAFSLVHVLLKIPEKKPKEELHPLVLDAIKNI